VRQTCWILLVVLSVSAGCTSGGIQPTVVPSHCGASDPLTILVLGDSIAAGHPLQAPDRWSDVLERTLRLVQPSRVVEIRNLAKNATRVDFLASSIAAEPDLSKYRVAIVIEGVNDVGVTPLDDWARRYRTAVESLEASGVTVVVGTAPPAFAPGEFFDTYDQVATTLRTIAHERGRPLFDIDRQWSDLGPQAVEDFYADIIHQDAAGQITMADLAAPLVLSLPDIC
jgi:lysophospholipase L1-like esterase